MLLRYRSVPELRESSTTITNRVESFHTCSKWRCIGNAGIIADNDPEHMEQVVTGNALLANGGICSNAAELTAVLNQRCVAGNRRRSEDVAALSPYPTNHILRFGDDVLDLSPPRTAVHTHLDLSTEASAL